jgi:diguanylate cyclase (GGDEF)-like protein/PAS domain S-box-containing protein
LDADALAETKPAAAPAAGRPHEVARVTALVEVLVVLVMVLAAAGALYAGMGPGRPAVRWPWVLLGVGVLSYAFGEGYFFFVQETLPTFPTTADFFWLAFYPCVFAAIVLLVHEQRRSDSLGISLDAAIVAIAAGSVAYEVLFNGLVDIGRASSLLGGQLAYPVLDLGVLVMLSLIAVQSRNRVGNGYRLLGVGALLLLVTDLTNVRLLVGDGYTSGTLLDAGWAAGMGAFALACRFSTSIRDMRALRGGALYLATVASFAIAFTLLLAEAFGDRNPVVISLAAIVPCLILVRLVLSVRETDRLARDNESIIGAAGEGIFRADLAGRITYVNPAGLEMLGFGLHEVLGEWAHQLFHHSRSNGTPYPASECPILQSLGDGATHRVTDELFWCKDGSGLAVDYTSAPIRDGGRVVGVVTVFDDVTRQREMKEQLRHQADHDSLTGLYNRRRFEHEVAGQVSYAQRYSRPGVLLMMDLDSFKFVNDSYGHPAGDRLLCEVGAILESTVRETDVVARIGGDEFAVLLREAGEAEAVGVANGLVEAVRSRATPSVGVSVGIAAFDGAGERTPDELLVAADVALYEAKEAASGVAVYAGRGDRALTWVEQIRAAVAEGRIAVYSQPIVDAVTRKEVREELLLRMVDSHGDAIPPAAFLPAAERFGMIHEIDLLVLAQAVELARSGRPVAVNVSALSLGYAPYLERVEAGVGEGVDPRCLNFEITETAAVANMDEARAFACRIRELGCSLALDDFGTGFSSFAYLKHIPAQYLKIDIEFIHELSRSPSDRQLVGAIVAIARGFGQETVAEGVENEETLRAVRELGVDYAQGFYVGRPRPLSEGPRAPELTLGHGAC